MTTITLERAQRNLPSLLKRVLGGEDIVIEVDGQRVRLAQMALPPELAAANAHAALKEMVAISQELGLE